MPLRENEQRKPLKITEERKQALQLERDKALASDFLERLSEYCTHNEEVSYGQLTMGTMPGAGRGPRGAGRHDMPICEV